MKQKRFEENYFHGPLYQHEGLDTVSNAKEHIAYLRSFSQIFSIPQNHFLELGFGRGELFRETNKVFQPKTHVGVDISQLAFDSLSPFTKKKKAELFRGSVMDFPFQDYEDGFFDWTISMGMVHYLNSKEREYFFEQVARVSKYVYFFVPTKNDIIAMREDGFYDEYAQLVPKATYKKLFQKYKLQIISMYVLQSYHYEIPQIELWMD